MNSQTVPTTYRVKLKKRFSVAEGTMAFEFEKPKGFAFRAGQSVDITLIHSFEMDEKGNVRAFSIASAPHEESLMIATRMRDTAFKRELARMALNTEVKLDGPSGNLTLHNNPSRPAILLGGGIGVTPIRSILLRAAREKLPHRILLFYSNRRPEDAAFLQELEALQSENPNYTFIPTMTKLKESLHPWKGETGRISREMMARYMGGIESPICYVVGPPPMVHDVHRTLNELGIDDDDIRTEDFIGY